MGLLRSLLAQSPSRSPSSDYWYMPLGSVSKSGVQVDEDTAMRITAVLQGVRFICQTVAGLPRFMYRHLEDGRSRTKDVNHPLNRILRFQPNTWQTSFQFIEMLTAHAMLRGIGLAERIFENDRLVGLVPLDANRLVRIEQRANGMLRYHYRQENGSVRMLLQEEVFSVTGFGIKNGSFKGLPLVEQMRDAAGLAVATEAYGSVFFSNSAMPRVVLTNPHALTLETRNRMRESWDSMFSRQGQHSTAVLEDGTSIQTLSTNNDEAQFIETRKFLISEFSRVLDVTPHRLSDMEKTSYNNVEQMSLETVVYTIAPWVERWEQSIYRDLVTEEDKDAGYFFEFSLEGLLRGDTEARAEFYSKGINTGWMTRNEVRQKENLNPIEGLDEPLQPVNMAPVSQADEFARIEPAAANGNRARLIARAAAERIIRCEETALAKQRNGREWRSHVERFYDKHADFVSAALAIDRARAERWCADRCKAALEGKLAQAEEAVTLLTEEALKP